MIPDDKNDDDDDVFSLGGVGTDKTILVRAIASPQRCSFCDGTWFPIERVDNKESAILHSDPECSQFSKLSLDEFMRQNRISKS